MSRIAFPEPCWPVTVRQWTPPPPWGFLEWFVVSQTILPALLYLPMFQGLRLPIRIGAFVISLAGLGWTTVSRRRSRVAHPSTVWIISALGYLALMIFHPTTNTTLAGVGQVMLYVAVAAPAFWAPRLIAGPAHLERLLWLLLVLNGTNAGVGVLQVYAPATWMPSELTAVDSSGVVQITPKAALGGARFLSYRGPEGEIIIRPPGLFDSPGAVAGPGMFAGLIGLVFFVSTASMFKKAVALLFAFLAVSVIYLTQVRTSLIVFLGMVLVYVLTLVIRKRVGQAAVLVGLAAVMAFTALTLAVIIGGGSIRDRFATLTENPTSVYYASRGQQLEHGFTHYLTAYPFGAGLGRWGMMRSYFGDPTNLRSPLIWAEIQFPAWILDGGLILLVLYSAAVAVSIGEAAALAARARSEKLWSVAALVFAVNAGTVALTLSFTPFTTQIGLQYWLLSGALHGAALHARDETEATLLGAA